jgi:DNA polymerase
MDTLESLALAVENCTDCTLCQQRTRSVPGEGPERPDIMFIGEGPGYHEDQQGRPFVGPAGKLLEELLATIGLTRRDVYIANVVKCRPPNNRDPLPDEIKACRKYLDQQIRLLDPPVIATLGRYSMARFMPGAIISRVHGKPPQWGKRTILPLYHPAAALRQFSLRGYLEEDFRKLPALVEEARHNAASAEQEEPEAQPEQLKML